MSLVLFGEDGTGQASLLRAKLQKVQECPGLVFWGKLLPSLPDLISELGDFLFIGQQAAPLTGQAVHLAVGSLLQSRLVDEWRAHVDCRILSYPALSIGNRRTRIRPSVTVISAPPSNASWCCSTITRRCRFTLAGCIYRKRKRRDSHVGQEFHTTVNSSAWTDSSANQAAYANAWRMSSGSR